MGFFRKKKEEVEKFDNSRRQFLKTAGAVGVGLSPFGRVMNAFAKGRISLTQGYGLVKDYKRKEFIHYFHNCGDDVLKFILLNPRQKMIGDTPYEIIVDELFDRNTNNRSELGGEIVELDRNIHNNQPLVSMAHMGVFKKIVSGKTSPSKDGRSPYYKDFFWFVSKYDKNEISKVKGHLVKLIDKTVYFDYRNSFNDLLKSFEHDSAIEYDYAKNKNALTNILSRFKGGVRNDYSSYENNFVRLYHATLAMYCYCLHFEHEWLRKARNEQDYNYFKPYTPNSFENHDDDARRVHYLSTEIFPLLQQAFINNGGFSIRPKSLQEENYLDNIIWVEKRQANLGNFDKQQNIIVYNKRDFPHLYKQKFVSS